MFPFYDNFSINTFQLFFLPSRNKFFVMNTSSHTNYLYKKETDKKKHFVC